MNYILSLISFWKFLKQLLFLICWFAFFFFQDVTSNDGEFEKAPFLAKPVRLTPAWEANNLPNDELNFKGNIRLNLYTENSIQELKHLQFN